MNVYSVDIQIGATAYIKANTEAEALAIARGLPNSIIALSDRYQPAGENLCIDGRVYACLADNEETVALSPLMTINGTFNADSVDFVQELGADA